MSLRSATSAKPDVDSSLPSDSNQSFPKSRRLLRRADFQRVYDGGAKFPGPYFLLFVLGREEDGPCRIGLTASRKVGNAVIRNRAKRLLREAVRRHWDAVPASCDCVLHVRTGIRDASFAQVESEVLRTMKRARATLKAE